jgi:hypothetical protein
MAAQVASGGGAALPPASIPKWPIGEPNDDWNDAQLKLCLKSKSQSKVGRSRGKDLRTSFTKLTVAMPANLAVAIEHSGCLYPKNSLSVDGSWLGTKAFKPCR